jgi:hypothetical protein
LFSNKIRIHYFNKDISVPMPKLRTFALAAAALFISGTVAVFVSGSAPAEPKPRTHLTIYVQPPLSVEGGSISVAGRAIPEEEWRRMQDGPNPAESDTSNPKRQHVNAGDQHIGVTASSRATVVEFFYPENGGYTFNLRSVRDNSRDPLQTKEVRYGSGGAIDPETREEIAWSRRSIIYVAGPRHDESWARLAGDRVHRALRYVNAEELPISRFRGARVMEMSEAAIGKYIVDTK